MEYMETLPPYAYAAVGAIVVLMLLLIILGMRRSLARAKGAAQDLFSGLEGLGLKKTKQDKAKTQLQGSYRGRNVAMHIDGSAVTKAGNKAMRSSLFAAAKELGGIGGIGGGDDADDDWEEQEEEDERDESVQNAAMVLRWAVVLPLNSPVAIKVGHRKGDGESLGKNLYATFDEQARAGMTDPKVVEALSQAQFNSIAVKGKKVLCTWTPPMKEYQKYSSNEAFTGVSRRALDALCTMCDSLYGPAA